MRNKLGQKIIDKIRGKETSNFRKSYSQCGEDMLVYSILGEKINYLEIGAHHSECLSNTKFFYDKGSTGVLIEPDPELYKEIKTHRKKDICLNVGIGVDEAKEIEFYIFEPSFLNTTIKDSIEDLLKHPDVKFKNTIKIELKNINNILETYFKNGLDFLSIDTEGLDDKIIKSLNFEKHRPKVICIESKEVNDYLISKNYFVYAYNNLNTIFVDNEYRVYKTL